MKFPLPINQVADGLWVGPCPHDPEFIRALKQVHGLTGLVNLQTDADLESMGLAWPLMWRFLMSVGISAQRVIITDFDDRSLLAGLDEAVSAVNDMISGGHMTYLHCTAGVNRSPTTAIAWLTRHGGLSIDDAWDQVTSRRRCMPNRKVLQDWVAQ